MLYDIDINAFIAIDGFIAMILMLCINVFIAMLFMLIDIYL